MMKYAFFCIIIINSICAFGQTKITSKSGDELVGYVVFESDSIIQLDNFIGNKSVVYKKDYFSRDRITSLVKLKNDTTFYCHIFSVNSDSICILGENNVRYSIDREEIYSFEIKDIPLTDRYFLLGWTLNIRGGISFLGGLKMPSDLFFSFQLGILLFIEKSLQLNFGYIFYSLPDFDMSASVGAGVYIRDDHSWYGPSHYVQYYGGFLKARYNVFIAELGTVVVIHSPVVSNTSLFFQLGLEFQL